MERDTRQTVEPPTPPERYEPPAVEWEEPFDAVAASCEEWVFPRPPECPPL